VFSVTLLLIQPFELVLFCAFMCFAYHPLSSPFCCSGSIWTGGLFD